MSPREEILKHNRLDKLSRLRQAIAYAHQGTSIKGGKLQKHMIAQLLDELEESITQSPYTPLEKSK